MKKGKKDEMGGEKRRGRKNKTVKIHCVKAKCQKSTAMVIVSTMVVVRWFLGLMHEVSLKDKKRYADTRLCYNRTKIKKTQNANQY